MRHTRSYSLGDTLLNACLHLASQIGYGVAGLCQTARHTFEILRKGYAVGAVHHADVVQTGFIRGRSVEQTQTSVHAEVLVDLAGSTHLNAEIVLLALHIAVDVVARHVGHAGTKLAERCVQLL